MLNAGYGFTDRISIKLWLPYRDVTAPKTVTDSEGNKTRITRRFSGLSDTLVMGYYQAKGPATGSSNRWTIGLGMRIPTGNAQPNHEWEDTGLSRDPVLQTGSGTLDPIVSTSYAGNLWGRRAFASLLARFTEGENVYGYKYSDEYQYAFGTSYRAGDGVSGALALTGIHSGHDYDHGVEVSNTGGNWIYFTPSANIGTGKWLSTVSLQIPLYQNVNNPQLVSDFVFNLGITGKRRAQGSASLSNAPSIHQTPDTLSTKPSHACSIEGHEPCQADPQKGVEEQATGKHAHDEHTSTPTTSHKAPDIRTVSLGETLDLTHFTVAGKVTLFEFYSDTCRSCSAFEPELNAFARSHPNNLAIRKINIGDGKTPVVNQHHIKATPTLVVFDEKGRQIHRWEGGNLEIIRKLLP